MLQHANLQTNNAARMSTWISFRDENDQIEKKEFPLTAVDEHGEVLVSRDQSEIFVGALACLNLTN